jgi:hypothetical protein
LHRHVLLDGAERAPSESVLELEEEMAEISELLVERPSADTRLGANVIDGRGSEALPGKHARRGGEEPRALGADALFGRVRAVVLAARGRAIVLTASAPPACFLQSICAHGDATFTQARAGRK